MKEIALAVSSIWGNSSNTQKHRLAVIYAVGSEEALGIHIESVRRELGDAYHLQSWLTCKVPEKEPQP